MKKIVKGLISVLTAVLLIVLAAACVKDSSGGETTAADQLTGQNPESPNPEITAEDGVDTDPSNPASPTVSENPGADVVTEQTQPSDEPSDGETSAESDDLDAESETEPETEPEPEPMPEPARLNPNVIADEKLVLDDEERKHYSVINDTLVSYEGASDTLIIPSDVVHFSPAEFTSLTAFTNVYVEEGNVNFVSRDGLLYDATGEALVFYPTGRSEENVVIPDYTLYIEDSACTGALSMKTLTLNEGLMQIYSFAFGYCTSLETVTFPSTLTYIGVTAFKDCTALTSVALPEALTVIDHAAFFCCTNLTEVTLGSAVTSIGHNAFSDTNLTSINIPETVKTFCTYAGESPFDHTPWYESLTDEYVTAGDGVLIKYNGENTEVVIPYTVKHIAPFVFGYTNTVNKLFMNRAVIQIEPENWAQGVAIEYVG